MRTTLLTLLLASLPCLAHADPAPTAPPAAPDDVNGEVIVVHDHIGKPVPPQSITDPGIVPAYSDRAALGNYWAKAWLLLDVSENGVVDRVKWLKRPGYDLEDIAVATAFKQKYTPGYDERGHVRRWLMIYQVEWPSMWWLTQWQGTSTHLPPPGVLARVHCIGSGPFSVLRDCSRPDITKASSEPWIKSH